MARIRSIKPEFFEDELLGSLPRDARLLFIGLWTVADDHGRFRSSPAALKAAVFPYDEDISAGDVTVLMGELVATRRVVLYESGGQRYGAVVNWAKHQRIDNAGKEKYPAPPEGVENQPVEVPSSWSGETRGEIPRTSRDSRLEGIGREGKGREGTADPSPPKPAALPCEPVAVVEAWNTEAHPPLSKVLDFTDKRRKAVRSRLAEDRGRVEDWWREYFRRIKATPFLCGDNDRGWRADFDFAIKADSIAKVHEGKYDRAGPVKRQQDELPNLNANAKKAAS